MEATKGTVRQELDEIMECLRVAEERLDRALEAINGREVQGNVCVGEENCDAVRREPGVMERLVFVGKRASCVAVKAETLADAL